ncbi:MAG: recombination mediator RecR [Bacilli bacterium]
MNYPTTIRNMIECFKKLPGIGEKTAERLALATLKLDDDVTNLFSKSLCDIKTKIKRCVVCNNLTENEKCDICLDETRNKQIICIVQEPKNTIMLEKSNVYNGQYHIIDNLISPLDGINPSDINLSTLKERIISNSIEEVIIVLKQSIEGETTTLYITKMLESTGVKITKIAQGIPHGADMDYVDYLTLEKAIEDRKEVS